MNSLYDNPITLPIIYAALFIISIYDVRALHKFPAATLKMIDGKLASMKNLGFVLELKSMLDAMHLRREWLRERKLMAIRS